MRLGRPHASVRRGWQMSDNQTRKGRRARNQLLRTLDGRVVRIGGGIRGRMTAPAQAGVPQLTPTSVAADAGTGAGDRDSRGTA
jgi:hypothetical protein